MDCRLVIIFLIIGALCLDVEARKCGPGKIRKCRRDLRNFNQRASILGDADEYPCDAASEVKNCFVSYAEECYDTESEINDFLSENIPELQEKLTEECEVHECLESVEEDAGYCLETTVARITDIFSGNTVDTDSVNEDKLKCMVFEMIVDCIVAKVHDSCGDEIAEMFETGLKEEASEIIDACNSGEAPDLESLLGLKKK